jgi:FAD/FMN-containing dehydrogenase
MVTREELQGLAQSLRGEVIGPDARGYDESRKVWNGMIDRRPALIARCSGVADVMDTIAFAERNGLPLAVRGGGHNVAGHAVCDAGVVLDLSLMKGIRVDPKAKLAHAQGGATWGDLDRETQRFGLATPGGLVSTTGIAGLTLCGGIGHLRRKHGLSCDNLESVDVVTAGGALVTASRTENADLFWAIRGGGGNFGVVASFTFRLHELGPTVMFVGTMYPVAGGREIVRGWREFMATAPDEVSSQAMFWSVPDMAGFPDHVRGKPVVVVVALYAGNAEDGARVLAPLRELATPLLDMSGPAPYAQVQSSFDYVFPKGELHHYWKSLYLRELSEQVIADVAAAGADRPSPRTFVNLWHMGGAMSRVGASESAFGDRSSPYLLEISSTWENPSEGAANIAWTRAFWNAMSRYSDGNVYLNWPGSDGEGEEQVRTAYGANYARLSELKRIYDPKNLFNLNQNIRPAR